MKIIERSPNNSMYKRNNLSSCDCYSCDNNFYKLNKQVENNCNISPYFECKNRLVFKNQVEPSGKYGYNILNPTVITSKYDSEFYETQCDSDSIKSCSKNIYSKPQWSI